MIYQINKPVDVQFWKERRNLYSFRISIHSRREIAHLVKRPECYECSVDAYKYININNLLRHNLDKKSHYKLIQFVKPHECVTYSYFSF